jgi:hypothetical protein
LYPGIVNSPYATLAASIDTDDNVIAVSELSYFPSGPNIATIGNDDEENPETVKYTSTSAASGAGNLTGVERGFQGTAQSWGSGTYVRRTFTEYDYDALCDNIVGHDHTGGIGSDAPHRVSMSRQAIINGNFDIWQRGTSFTSATTITNSDDTYLPDRWILLSDGNDIVDVSRESTVIPEGSAYSLKCEVETANKKFGWLQILESVDSLKFAGKEVSISFQARTTDSKVIENIRAAVISWNSTADTVTSDVVSAWENEGTNPTLVANWTYENTPANLALTTSFQTFTIEGITIDTSGMTNVAVFIWIDDTDAAVDDLLYISQVQLCEGDVALPFEPKSYLEELMTCLRYCFALNPDFINPYGGFAFGQSPTTTVTRFTMPLPVPMRVTPTMGSITAKTTWQCSTPDGNYGGNLTLAYVGTYGVRAINLGGTNDTTNLTVGYASRLFSFGGNFILSSEL